MTLTPEISEELLSLTQLLLDLLKPNPSKLFIKPLFNLINC